MSDIKIQEYEMPLDNGGKGKMAIFMYVGENDPVLELDKAVSEYVAHETHIEFMDTHIDNPFVRVVLSDLNKLKLEDFDPKKYQMAS